MPREEEELVGEKEKYLEEAEAQLQVKRAAVLSLLVQQRGTIAHEEDDHLNEDEEKVGAEELSSAIVAIRWDTCRMTVLKENQQEGEELMLLSRRMLRQHRQKLRMHQKQAKPWC